MWQIVGSRHSLTEQEEKPLLNYKSVPGRRSIQSDGEMDLLDSKQTSDSLPAEHQAKNEISNSRLPVSSRGGRKYLKRKIYMGLMGLRDGCLRTEMFEKLRFLILLSELSFSIQHE